MGKLYVLVVWCIALGALFQKVFRWIDLAYAVKGLRNMSKWCCRYLRRRTKIQIFKALVLDVLLYDRKTLTLNSDLLEASQCLWYYVSLLNLGVLLE